MVTELKSQLDELYNSRYIEMSLLLPNGRAVHQQQSSPKMKYTTCGESASTNMLFAIEIEREFDKILGMEEYNSKTKNKG